MSDQPSNSRGLSALRAVVLELQESVSNLSAYLTEQSEVSQPTTLMFNQAIKESSDQVGHRNQLRKLAKREYTERSRRFSLLEEDLFGEPAWDILLDLFIADVDQTRVSVTSACIAARVPTSTALRWIRLLEDRQLIERSVDPNDGRRIWVQLTRSGRSRMEHLFSERLANT